MEIKQEEKAMLRAQIGSRPPKCERRCSSCGPCEAIQVPTNPQTKFGGKNSSLSIPTIEYARGGDDSSNYKPMSWKCKCGNSIFNPWLEVVLYIHFEDYCSDLSFWIWLCVYRMSDTFYTLIPSWNMKFYFRFGFSINPCCEDYMLGLA